MLLDALATELHQVILSSLDVSGLVGLRQVSRYWRGLVDDALEKPGIVVTAARAALVRLHLDLHQYESFRASRQHVLPHLESFSREAYVERLREKFSADEDEDGRRSTLPDMFETWVLEWPERAVIGWVWPGLDGRFAADVCPLNSKVLNPFERGRERWYRTYGRNALHMTAAPGTPRGAAEDDGEGDDDGSENGHGPSARLDGRDVLLVQEHGFELKTFLVLDNPGDHTDGGQVWCEGLDDGSSGNGGEGGVRRSQLTQYQVLPDWVAFLRRELDLIERHYLPGKRAGQGRISEADILHYVMEKEEEPERGRWL